MKQNILLINIYLIWNVRTYLYKSDSHRKKSDWKSEKRPYWNELKMSCPLFHASVENRYFEYPINTNKFKLPLSNIITYFCFFQIFIHGMYIAHFCGIVILHEFKQMRDSILLLISSVAEFFPSFQMRLKTQW